MELTIINNTGEELTANYDLSGVTMMMANNYAIEALDGFIDIDETSEVAALYRYSPPIFDDPEEYSVGFCYVYGENVKTAASATDLVNCTFGTNNGIVKLNITDPSKPSRAVVTLNKIAR